MQRTLERKSAPEEHPARLASEKSASAPQTSPRRGIRTAGVSRFFGPARNFDPNQPELMDRPDVNKAWLREELETLEKLNRLGGHQLMLRYIRKLLGTRKLEGLNILDLATGAADIPRAIVAWGRTRGVRVTVTAVDGNEEVLRSAREWCRDWPEIQLERYDLLQLPYPAQTFDIVLCSLALHHFRSEHAVAILRRMNEIARIGFILNDLQRNWPAIWTAELLARTLMRSPIVRNDGPQSFRAAFTVRELRAMAHEAGMTDFSIKRHQVLFRMVLAGGK